MIFNPLLLACYTCDVLQVYVLPELVYDYPNQKIRSGCDTFSMAVVMRTWESTWTVTLIELCGAPRRLCPIGRVHTKSVKGVPAGNGKLATLCSENEQSVLRIMYYLDLQSTPKRHP